MTVLAGYWKETRAANGVRTLGTLRRSKMRGLKRRGGYMFRPEIFKQPEWDTAETLGQHYYVYYLVVNESQKNIFVIQNPVKQFKEGNLKVDKHFVVEFLKESGQWQKLLEVKSSK